MASLAKLLHSFGVLLALGSFGSALLAALAAGVDPLWALLRAIGCFAGVIVIYSILCRLAVPFAGMFEEKTPTEPAPGEPAEEEELAA